MAARSFYLSSASIALAALAANLPAPVLAQASGTAAQAYEEIVVSAQRREERAVDVPITITSLDPDALRTANVEELSDIVKVTPSLRFDNQGAFAQPTIRGIGTSVTTSGGGSNVGIYIDGFYSPNPLAADSELLNVSSIQVLKGPQGTLFGRNTTGGAVLVQTAEPSVEPAARFRASYGRFDQTRLQGYATYGVTDRIAVDLEGQYRRGDGWIRNIMTGSEKDGQYETWSVRAGAKFELSDTVSLLLRYQHNEIDDPTSLLTNTYVDPVLGLTTPNFAVPGTYTTKPNEYAGTNPRFFRSNNEVLQATLKVDFGFADLASYTQYRHENVDMSQDLDQIGMTIFQIGFPVENNTWSQEFLLTSRPGGRLQWTAGLFYFSNQDAWQTFIDNAGAVEGEGRVRLGGSGTNTKTFAAFADLTYEFTPSLFLTVGGRVSHDRIDDAYYILPGSGHRTPVTDEQADAVKQERFTPRLVLRYMPTEQSSLYASYTQGYKAGILDVGGATGNPVEPEKVHAFEVGYKYGGRGLSLDISGYYYDYKDLQVSLYRGNPPSAQIVNAASSEIYGIEGQLRYDVTEQFQVNLGASWTHARYKRFENVPIYLRCPDIAGCGGGTSFYILTGVTLRDVTMQRTPKFTGNIGASYSADVGGGQLLLSGNLYYTSKFHFGPSGIQFPQKGYEVLSLRAQWTDPSERYTVGLWGDNVTNSRYRTQVQFNNFGIGSTWSAPVTYGLDFGVKF